MKRVGLLGCASVAAVAAVAAGSGPVLAQPQQGPGSEAAGVETIVVTAQRREQRLQDVPLAVSAVSGAALRDAGIASTTDLRFVAPSVSYGVSANSRGEGLQVRGVGTQIFGDGVEQSVGVVIDGVPLGRNGMGIADLVDVERIEVLRGPQGMLFGKNASAGLVNVITTAPRPGELSLTLRGSYATLEDRSASATANLPLGEDAALRITWQSRSRDGFVENIQRREQLNGLDNTALRARFLANISETARVQIFADQTNSNTSCCAWTARAAPATTVFGAQNALAGITPSPANLRNAAGARFFQNMDNWGVATQADVELDFATLTVMGAYRYWFAADNNDPDILPLNVLDRNAGDSTVDQTTFEARLTSPGGSAVEWTLGVFALDMRNSGGNLQAGTLGLSLPPGATLGADRRSVTINRSSAVFGQIAVSPLERLKLSAGVRLTSEQLKVDWSQTQASGTIGTIPGRFYGTSVASRDTDNTSWRVTAQYDISPDIMVFVGAARGYKGPAYDQQLVNSTVVFTNPEIPTSIEAGLRSSLAAGRVIFNATVFETVFQDFQAQVFDQNVFPSRFTTANAGELETRGLEVDFRARPLTDLTVTGNLALIEATYTDFRNVACYAGQPQLPFGTVRTSPRECIRIISATGPFVTEATGNPLTNAPELAWTLAVAYERPVGPMTGFAQASYAYRSETSFSAAGDPAARQEGYGLLGARLGVRANDGAWSVSVFGRNLTDEVFVNNIIAQPVLGAAGVYSQFPSADSRRTLGVALEMRWGQ
jgi:iron complex outermembrane receptor protein